MPDDQTPLEDLLRRRPWEGGAAGELCGDPELLAAYAEGQLPLKARERLEQHLADCAACQAAVVRLVRLAPQESAAARAASGTQAARSPRISPLFRWRWALPTLAGVILVGSVIYYEPFQIVSPRPSTTPARIADQVAPAPESPTGPEAPQAPVEVVTSRSGPLGEADKARAVGGTTVGRTIVGGTRAAVASEEERWRQQPQQEPKGNFAAYKAPTTTPVPAAPSPSLASALRSGADRLEHLESSAQRTLKKEAELPARLIKQLHRGKPVVRAKASVANELADRRRAQTAPKPSRSKELQKAAAEPENAAKAKSAMTREGRLAERADVAEEAQEKGTRRAGVVGRQYASAASQEEGASAATGLKARDAQMRGPFRKQIPGATHRLALTCLRPAAGGPRGVRQMAAADYPVGPLKRRGHRFRRFRRSPVGAVGRGAGITLPQFGRDLGYYG